MSFKNIIMFIEYIIEMTKYYLGLLLNKIGIERKNKVFVENKNWEILNDYYNENYDIDRELEEEYLGKYYNGYEVEDGKWLKRKENMNIEEERNFDLISYKFRLPIHEEVLNKLEINIDRSKYKFIYVLLITKNYIKYSSEDKNVYEFLNNFYEEINFIFVYESSFKEDMNCDIKKNKASYELLLCVNSENMISVMDALNNVEEFREYECVIREVDDEIEFFKGNYLFKQLNNKLFCKNHLSHCFLVYKLDEKLEDYYILGNYINGFNPMVVLFYHYADVINLDLYARQHYSPKEMEKINELDEADRIKIENKIKEKIKRRKDKMYKNIKNKYLKRTYGSYILLHINLLDKYRYKIKLFLSKIKKLNLIYCMGFFKAKSINEITAFNERFFKFNYDFKKDKIYNYGEVKRQYQDFFKNTDNKQAIDEIQVDFKHSKKAFFEDSEFNWEVIKSINNYKNMLSHMNSCKGKTEESFNKFLTENSTIGNTLEYGEDLKLSNFNEVNNSVLFRKYDVEVWDKHRLLDEIDFNVNRLEDIDIQRAFKHLVLSIKNEDKVIFYPLTHSEYLRIDVSILRQQILENRNINIDEEILNKLIGELKQIKNIEIKNVELYKYTHNKVEERQYRTGKFFECKKKNEVLIPEKREVLIPKKREVLIPEKQEVLLPDYKTVIRKYNDNHECLTASHNLRMNVKKIKEDDIYNMCNNNKVEYIFNPENNGLRKFSEVFNYLKEYFLV